MRLNGCCLLQHTPTHFQYVKDNQHTNPADFVALRLCINFRIYLLRTYALLCGFCQYVNCKRFCLTGSLALSLSTPPNIGLNFQNSFLLHDTHEVLKEHACARGECINTNTQHIENHILAKKVNKNGKGKVD